MKTTFPIGTVDNLGTAELPPLPSVFEHATLRAYAVRLVSRLGVAAATILAAELDEACEEEVELDRITKGPPR
jgi:hypothetical protein